MSAAPLDPARRALYRGGHTGVFALPADPRFHYTLYVPPKPPKRLLVAVHHSLGNFVECRDGFADFGERYDCVVLAPSFPIGPLGDGNPDGYKFLQDGDIRHDRVLDAMVEAVAADTGCPAERFLIFGYSGGAQFAHRYLLLHPQRLLGAAIGAPGQVTLPDVAHDWWVGLRDVREQFGVEFDAEALRRVPVQLVVGSDDTQEDQLHHAAGSRYWREHVGVNHGSRIHRLASFEQALRSLGVTTRMELMPGVRHGAGSQPARALAQRFFAELIEAGAA